MSIYVKDLSFSYAEKRILNRVSFQAQTGKLTAVLGPNGAGKSTLFKCLLGLIKDYSGIIEMDGLNPATATAKRLAAAVAYIPQSHHPVFGFSVADMVVMGTTPALNRFAMPSSAEISRAEESLERLGISFLKDRNYLEISGGERQLVLIARALAQNAKILVMDEPTANLDFGNQLRVLRQIGALAKDGYTVLYSTHNPDQAYYFSDEVLALRSGMVLAQGSPADVVKTDVLKVLYGADVRVESFAGDKYRCCVPNDFS